MEPTVSIVQVVLSLLLVIGLIGLSAFALKYIHTKTTLLQAGFASKGELKIKEKLVIDVRTRLIVATWKHRDYLILVHPDGANILDVEEDLKDA